MLVGGGFFWKVGRVRACKACLVVAPVEARNGCFELLLLRIQVLIAGAFDDSGRVSRRSVSWLPSRFSRLAGNSSVHRDGMAAVRLVRRGDSCGWPVLLQRWERHLELELPAIRIWFRGHRLFRTLPRPCGEDGCRQEARRSHTSGGSTSGAHCGEVHPPGI